MYINLQVLLGATLSTLALTSWVPKSAKPDHSSRTTLDDEINISTPFNLTANGGSVGYGTTAVAGDGFRALVIQRYGVGSTFTLVEGLLITSDNMNVCRWVVEDRSLNPKRMYAAPVNGDGQQLVRWQVSSSGGVRKLLLLGSDARM